MNLSQFILFLFIPVNIILSLFIFFNNPRSWTNRLFSLLIFIFTIYLIINTEVYVVTNYTFKLLLARSIMAVASWINLFVFLFLTTFPKDKITFSKPILYSLLALTVFLFLSAYSNLIFAEINVSQNIIVPVPGLLMPLFLIHTLALIGGGIFWIFIRYRRSHGLEKNRIRFIFLGFFILFSFIIILNFIFAVFLKIGNFVPLLPIYLLIFNAIVGYAIIRHRLLDIRLVVARTVSYTLLIGLFGFLYALFFSSSSIFFLSQSLLSKTITISTILALVMAFSFQTVRRYLEKITDRIFYKHHYNTNKLLYDLTVIMASTLRLEDLTHQLLKELLSQMRVARGAFILIDEDRIYEVAHEGYKETPSLNEKHVLSLTKEYTTIVFDELPEGNMKQVMRELNISTSITLRTAGQQIGLMTLGEKLSGDIYTSEDIRVLEIFVPEAAVAIKNALAYEEIQRFNVTLKEQIKQATTNLAKANIRLKELDKLKDEFVSLASHELRTPMTAIKSYLWLALNRSPQPLASETKKNLEISLEETERLIKLVQNMLTISRIEGKRLELNIEPVNVVELVKRLFDELKIKADEKNMHFTFVPYPEKLRINGDKDKLAEVLQNIIGNALKFTPEKGNISISFTREHDRIAINVSDTGRGISKEDQSKLFKKFGRLQESKGNRTSGTGLGLYITKQIVTLHKGEIKVKSEVGKGTTFTIYLPLA